MTSKISFTLSSRVGVNYEMWVSVTNKVLDILNTYHITHFATPLTIVGEIDNICRAETHYQYTTNDTIEKTNDTYLIIGAQLANIGLVRDLKME